MIQRSRADQLTQYIRSSVPEVLQIATDSWREAVQTSVWLVSLSTGMLALLLANESLANALSQTSRVVLSALLLATVFFGVVQRFAHSVAESRFRTRNFELQATIAGMSSELDEPWSLQDCWTSEDIVAQLKAKFDLDYSWLIEDGSSLDSCREAYTGQYKLWQKHSDDDVKRVMSILSAFVGWTDEQGQALLKPQETEVWLGSVRQKARSAKRSAMVASVLFFACGTCFIAAVAFLAVALAGA